MKKFALVVVLVVGFVDAAFGGDIASEDREIKKKAYDTAVRVWEEKKKPILLLDERIDEARAALRYWEEQKKALAAEKAMKKADDGFKALSTAHAALKANDNAKTRVAYANAASKFIKPATVLKNSFAASATKRIQLEQELVMELKRLDLPSLETVLDEKIAEAQEAYDDLVAEKNETELDPDYIEAKARFDAAAVAWYDVSQTSSLDVTARQLIALNQKIDNLITELAATRVASEKQADALVKILNWVESAKKSGTSTEKIQSVLKDTQTTLRTTSGVYQVHWDPVNCCYYYTH